MMTMMYPWNTTYVTKNTFGFVRVKPKRDGHMNKTWTTYGDGVPHHCTHDMHHSLSQVSLSISSTLPVSAHGCSVCRVEISESRASPEIRSLGRWVIMMRAHVQLCQMTPCRMHPLHASRWRFVPLVITPLCAQLMKVWGGPICILDPPHHVSVGNSCTDNWPAYIQSNQSTQVRCSIRESRSRVACFSTFGADEN